MTFFFSFDPKRIHTLVSGSLGLDLNVVPYSGISRVSLGADMYAKEVQ